MDNFLSDFSAKVPVQIVPISGTLRQKLPHADEVSDSQSNLSHNYERLRFLPQVFLLLRDGLTYYLGRARCVFQYHYCAIVSKNWQMKSSGTLPQYSCWAWRIAIEPSSPIWFEKFDEVQQNLIWRAGWFYLKFWSLRRTKGQSHLQILDSSWTTDTLFMGFCQFARVLEVNALYQGWNGTTHEKQVRSAKKSELNDVFYGCILAMLWLFKNFKICNP